MKFKLFTAGEPAKTEKAVNEWLAAEHITEVHSTSISVGNISVPKVTTVGGSTKRTIEDVTVISVAVWYD
jgi:hypothetical protein